MKMLCIWTTLFSYLILILWVLSLVVLWKIKDRLSKNSETQSRYFLTYTLLLGIFLIILIGSGLGIPDKYLSNVTTEIIGIAITVFLIDRIYKYINTKNEELYRKISLKVCRMPIYNYCANWLFIFEPDTKKLAKELQKYDSIENLFKSDDFYQRILDFNFNKLIGENKTYAQYYNEKMLEVSDRFQSILSKYASKLSHKDIPLLEHFSGGAYFFTVFAVMKFISEVKFTYKHGDETEKNVVPFNNKFRDISRENFNNHFDKLMELFKEYNNVVENDYEKWTIKNINQLQTIKSANDNPTTEW